MTKHVTSGCLPPSDPKWHTVQCFGGVRRWEVSGTSAEPFTADLCDKHAGKYIMHGYTLKPVLGAGHGHD